MAGGHNAGARRFRLVATVIAALVVGGAALGLARAIVGRGDREGEGTTAGTTAGPLSGIDRCTVEGNEDGRARLLCAQPDGSQTLVGEYRSGSPAPANQPADVVLPPLPLPAEASYVGSDTRPSGGQSWYYQLGPPTAHRDVVGFLLSAMVADGWKLGSPQLSAEADVHTAVLPGERDDSRVDVFVTSSPQDPEAGVTVQIDKIALAVP